MYSDIVHFYDEVVTAISSLVAGGFTLTMPMMDVTIDYDDMQEFLSEIKELRMKYLGVGI